MTNQTAEEDYKKAYLESYEVYKDYEAACETYKQDYKQAWEALLKTLAIV